MNELGHIFVLAGGCAAFYFAGRHDARVAAASVCCSLAKKQPRGTDYRFAAEDCAIAVEHGREAVGVPVLPLEAQLPPL